MGPSSSDLGEGNYALMVGHVDAHRRVAAGDQARGGGLAGDDLNAHRRVATSCSYWREGGDERGDGPGQAWATGKSFSISSVFVFLFCYLLLC